MTQTAPVSETCDVIVVGGSLGGLVIAHLLVGWGYSVKLIERSPVVGGIDRSFTNSNGRIFDVGLHALDYLRSEFTTRFLENVLDNELHRHVRRRGIVLRNHLIAYNAPKEEWPDELRALLPEEALVDELGSDPPNRENLGRFYGEAFADFIFDEVLPSYPSDVRHLKFGVDPSELLINIYPWFFPRAERQAVVLNTSRSYHDRIRERHREEFLYPMSGGFGAFPARLQEKISSAGSEVITGAQDLHVELDPDTRYIHWIETQGRRISAPRVYWCAPAHTLCELLDKPTVEIRPDHFVLGSFEFERPIRCDFTELIFGDPEHLINRASFPGRLGCVEDNLVSLEFAFPRQLERHPLKESYWLEKWVASLRRLGIVEAGNALVEFDFKSMPMVYNCYGIDGEPMPEIDFNGEIPAESNLRPVLPTIRKININTRVPQYLEFLAADLTRS